MCDDISWLTEVYATSRISLRDEGLPEEVADANFFLMNQVIINKSLHPMQDLFNKPSEEAGKHSPVEF